MNEKSNLLIVDGAVNLLLGMLLLISPAGLVDLLGLPAFTTAFYPTILGAVLLGIGLALLIERFGQSKGLSGLGIAGAIAINMCGGGTLLIWLIAGHLEIPARGRLLLWVVAVLVLGIGFLEAFSWAWRGAADSRTSV
jgi:hypothetical protein